MTLTLLAATTVRVSLLLVLGLLGARLLSRRSAAVRHHVMATTVWCALAIPFLVAALPSWHVAPGVLQPARESTEARPSGSGVSVATTVTAPAPTPRPSSLQAQPTQSRPLDLPSVLAGLWITGALVSGLTLLVVRPRCAQTGVMGR